MVKNISFINTMEIDIKFYTFKNIKIYFKNNNFFKIIQRLFFYGGKKNWAIYL